MSECPKDIGKNCCCQDHLYAQTDLPRDPEGDLAPPPPMIHFDRYITRGLPRFILTDEINNHKHAKK